MAHDFESEITLEVGAKLKCVGIRQGLVASGGWGMPQFYMRDIYDMEVVVDDEW